MTKGGQRAVRNRPPLPTRTLLDTSARAQPRKDFPVDKQYYAEERDLLQGGTYDAECTLVEEYPSRASSASR